MSNKTDAIYEFGSFRLDLSKSLLTQEGRAIPLSSKALEVLAVLVAGAPKPITKDQLFASVWPGTAVEENNLTVHISALRRVLGETPGDHRFIVTLPGQGYRFVAPLSLASGKRTLVSTDNPAPLALAAAEASESCRKQQAPHQNGRGFRPLVGSIILLVFAIALAGAYLSAWKPVAASQLKSKAVIAEFQNFTSDPVFDHAMRQGLLLGLEQSPLLRVMSDRKVEAVLKEMGRSPNENITGRVGTELCQRADGTVLIEGSISNLGSAYVVGLTATRCDSGEAIGREQTQARSKESVIPALGAAISRLRTRLGESIPSLQKFEVPLEEATTPSLEALKAYSLGFDAVDQKGDASAIPFYQRAIEIDPNFALAYGSLAESLGNLGESGQARVNATKAYQLRSRVTEFERLSIESWYHLYVTGDLQQMAQVLELTVSEFPDSFRSLNDLGAAYGTMGCNEKAIVLFRKALRLDPAAGLVSANLAESLLALNRIDEAETVIAEAKKRGNQNQYLLEAEYWISFLRHDKQKMQHLISTFSEEIDLHSTLLALQSYTEAYSGNLSKARRLAENSASLTEYGGQKETAASSLALAALWEAETGNTEFARAFAQRALRLSRNDDVATLTTLVTARTGNLKEARPWIEQLDKNNPQNTLIQKYWLPTIRAQVALQQGNWRLALDELRTAEPFELADTNTEEIGLYPAYVRGYAYLAAGNGPNAAAEFQKLINHPGLTVNSPLAALALLGRARALKLAGMPKDAQAGYEEFLVLWKDADPQTPILRQARMENSDLHS